MPSMSSGRPRPRVEEQEFSDVIVANSQLPQGPAQHDGDRRVQSPFAKAVAEDGCTRRLCDQVFRVVLRLRRHMLLFPILYAPKKDSREIWLLIPAWVCMPIAFLVVPKWLLPDCFASMKVSYLVTLVLWIVASRSTLLVGLPLKLVYCLRGYIARKVVVYLAMITDVLLCWNAVGALRSSESSCITAFCWAGVTFAMGSAASWYYVYIWLVEDLIEVMQQWLLLGRLQTCLHDPEGRLAGAGAEGDERHYPEYCPICLMQWEAFDVVKVAPCGHAFHEACIAKWIQTSETCVMCRSPFPNPTARPPGRRRATGAFSTAWVALPIPSPIPEGEPFPSPAMAVRPHPVLLGHDSGHLTPPRLDSGSGHLTPPRSGGHRTPPLAGQRTPPLTLGDLRDFQGDSGHVTPPLLPGHFATPPGAHDCGHPIDDMREDCATCQATRNWRGLLASGGSLTPLAHLPSGGGWAVVGPLGGPLTLVHSSSGQTAPPMLPGQRTPPLAGQRTPPLALGILHVHSGLAGSGHLTPPGQRTPPLAGQRTPPLAGQRTPPLAFGVLHMPLHMSTPRDDIVVGRPVTPPRSSTYD